LFILEEFVGVGGKLELGVRKGTVEPGLELVGIVTGTVEELDGGKIWVVVTVCVIVVTIGVKGVR
jgi:hypothetical protein